MNSTEITIYFEEAKAAALKAVLAQEGATIESKLQESLRFLYEQLVPVEQQSAIDALIKAQAEQERQEAEARKRFAVFHVRENGEDSYFTSQHFTSFHAAGYRYRLYARGDLSSQPAFKAFRGEYRTSLQRADLFDAALEDKEIEMGGMETDESEDAPVMQM